jgi:hypothetical protein
VGMFGYFLGSPLQVEGINHMFCFYTLELVTFAKTTSRIQEINPGRQCLLSR